MLKRRETLSRFVDDGSQPLDNNRCERAIRPVVMGRSNWLFAGSLAAGVRATRILSLLETAKMNVLEPHAWLTDVLTPASGSQEKRSSGDEVLSEVLGRSVAGAKSGGTMS